MRRRNSCCSGSDLTDGPIWTIGPVLVQHGMRQEPVPGWAAGIVSLVIMGGKAREIREGSTAGHLELYSASHVSAD